MSPVILWSVQPDWPGWNPRNTTKMVEHKLASFVAVVALRTIVGNFSNKANTHTSTVEIHVTQKLCYFGRWCESRAILPKTFRPGYPRWNVPMGKFSYRLIGRKNQDLSYRASLVSQINTLKFFTKERAARRNFENRAHMKRPTMNPPSRPGGVQCSNGLYQ